MNSCVEAAETVRPNRSTANIPVLPTLEQAERERVVLSRATHEVIVQLRLAENATARIRAAVSYAGRAVQELKSDARVVALARPVRGEKPSPVAESCRYIGQLEMLTSLELAGLESDLARARRTAEQHRRELDCFFVEQDGSCAGHAFGLRLRLLVQRAFTAPQFDPRCKLMNQLRLVSRSARRAAEEISQLRALIDQRVEALRDSVADITADVAGIAVGLGQ